MADPRRVYTTDDTAIVALYAKRAEDSPQAFPITAGMLTGGLRVPEHDTRIVDETDINNVTITYKLDGSTVATKTIVVSGSTTTITMVYP